MILRGGSASTFARCVMSAHLTQEVLAERCDLSVDAVRRIERGGFSPSLTTIGKRAIGLEVTFAMLLAGFERGRRNELTEIADLLATRTAREV